VQADDVGAGTVRRRWLGGYVGDTAVTDRREVAPQA